MTRSAPFLMALVASATTGCVFNAQASRKMGPLDEGLDLRAAQRDPLGRLPGRGGALEITSAPEEGARVLVDGVYVGRSPVTVRHLPPGEHEVVLNSVTGGRQTHRVEVLDGKTVPVSALLEGGDRDPGLTLLDRMIDADGGDALARLAWIHARFVMEGEGILATCESYETLAEARVRSHVDEATAYLIFVVRDFAVEHRVRADFVEKRTASGVESVEPALRQSLIDSFMFQSWRLLAAAIRGEVRAETVGEERNPGGNSLTRVRITRSGWRGQRVFFVDERTGITHGCEMSGTDGQRVRVTFSRWKDFGPLRLPTRLEFMHPDSDDQEPYQVTDVSEYRLGFVDVPE